jgi:Cys-rich protein (TIGR01571 family)
VPKGGVRAGQQFEVPAPIPYYSKSTPLVSTFDNSGKDEIVMGRWRYGLFECCDACWGPFCMGCCFPGIFAGQVFQRNKLNIWGSPAQDGGYKNTCAIMTFITLTVVMVTSALKTITTNQLLATLGDSAADYDDWVDVEVPTPPSAIIGSLVSNVFFLYLVIALTRARMEFRKRYQISGGCFGDGCQHDLCSAACCTFCTVIQMHRHTHDEYHIFSATGDAPNESLIRAQIV